MHPLTQRHRTIAQNFQIFMKKYVNFLKTVDNEIIDEYRCPLTQKKIDSAIKTQNRLRK